MINSQKYKKNLRYTKLFVLKYFVLILFLDVFIKKGKQLSCSPLLF